MGQSDRRGRLRSRNELVADPLGDTAALRARLTGWVGNYCPRPSGGQMSLSNSVPLVAVGILVLGAVLVLLLVTPISRRPILATLVGLPFPIVAAFLSVQTPEPLGLAVIALCGVACIALLLLPVLDA